MIQTKTSHESTTENTTTSRGALRTAFEQFRQGGSTVVGKGRTRVRHSYGAKGCTYRGYISAGRKSAAGRNLVHIRSLGEIRDLPISEQVVRVLLEYALAGDRHRKVIVTETAPGYVNVQVTFTHDDQTWSLGSDPIDATAPRMHCADLVRVKALLRRFSAMEEEFAALANDPMQRLAYQLKHSSSSIRMKLRS